MHSTADEFISDHEKTKPRRKSQRSQRSVVLRILRLRSTWRFKRYRAFPFFLQASGFLPTPSVTVPRFKQSICNINMTDPFDASERSQQFWLRHHFRSRFAPTASSREVD